NAFAMLGLRSLYFLLAGMIGRFVYLNAGLAMVLVFVGAKMLIADLYEPPIWASLGVIAVIIGTSVAGSLLFPLLRHRSFSPLVGRSQPRQPVTRGVCECPVAADPASAPIGRER